MTHIVRSIDALINNTPEAHPISPAKSPVNAPVVKSEPKNVENALESDVGTPKNVENEAKAPEEPKVEDAVTSSKTQENADKNIENTETSVTDVDEYGNPVAKPKTYTEEQVQAMIRDRLKRGAFKEPQPTPQQTQQAQAAGFEYNEGSEMSWSQQLEQFVENTMENVSKRKQQQQQQAIHHQNQVEFESKFHSGMAKYPDFIATMADHNVSDDMVMAIRGLDNPAAFLYTAAKRMPAELARISKLQDPYQQVAEMGRLHEKLAKPKGSSNAPRPLSQDKGGDITDRTPAKVSIDHLIHEDAKRRYGR